MSKVSSKNIIILSSLIYALQGIEALPLKSIEFYLKESLHFTPDKLMYILSFVGLAWTIKPFIGVFIDNLFSKKTWIVMSILGSLSISLYFIVSPMFSISALAILLLLSGYNAASRDIAIDGLACIEGKKNNKVEKIQSIQWISITVSGILLGIGGGYIAEKFNYKVGFLILIPIYLGILYISSIYKSVESHRGKETILFVLKSYKELFKNKQFLLACLFLFLYKYSPSFGTALWYVEQDEFGWGKIFLGILETIYSIASLVGAFLFYKYSDKINIHKTLYYSVFLGAIVSLSYLYFTPVSAIVYGIIYSTIGMVIHLIIMSWMARATLPGKESTSFALLCSISNIASTASMVSGAALLNVIGLKGLIVLSSLTSFVCLPLLSKIKIKKD